MAFEGPIDAPRLFVLGVSVVPVVCSYATAVVVRWFATRGGFRIDTPKYAFPGVVLALYVIAGSAAGVVLGATGGVPSGLVLGRTIAFSVTISSVPIALGALFFTLYLLSTLEASETTQGGGSSATSPVSSGGLLTVLAASNASFLLTFALSAPSLLVFGLLVG